MRGVIYIQTAIRTKDAYAFKNPVLGFSEFSVHSWQPMIFEFPYLKGSSKQTINDVLDAATKTLFDKYGKTNIRLQAVFDSWDGEKIPIV